ncbi:uncharacterized protein LOC120146591 [Hibiscus syriacus]|uniref:uncharacterized protein LOC120146591 n=1 Tax=Hibiscus syriacus TaxID=106335 RepID=UPI0019221542|nr:uncharacterized protein LOC120146591 [Hibiscus syriacus]
MDWRKLFGCSEGLDLEFHPPRVCEGITSVHPPPEVLEAGIEEWKLSLIGQFLGAAPNFAAMQRIVNNLWRKALDGSKVQIHFFNVPLELFSRSSLSYIASAIGSPFTMDSVTAAKTNLEFTKVYVEIGVKDIIPQYVEVVLKDRKTTYVVVEIPWLPSNCKNYCVFGHSDKNCNVQKLKAPTKQQVWKKKETIHLSQITEPVVGGIELLQESEPSIPILEEDSFKASTVLVSEPTVSNIEVSVVNTNNSDAPKKEMGRPVKNKSKLSLSVSNNIFEVLSVEDDYSIVHESNQRKTRHASLGVARIVNELKMKKKDSLVKAKNVEVGGFHSGFPFVITTVYGSNYGRERRLLWQQLRDLDRYIGHLPWVIGGDFNIILNSNESSDFDLLGPSSSSDMSDFQETLSDLELFNHPYVGPSFTWSNKQKNAFLARKLDRVLVNQTWSSSFHSSHVEFLAPGISDYCLALL